MRRIRSGEADTAAGFSLVELLVVLLLMGVIGTVAAHGMITGMRVNAKQSSRVQALNEVKKSFQRVTRDIRGANPVIVATATSITVREVEAGLRRDVTYSRSGADLVVHELQADNGTGATISESTKVVMTDLESDATALFSYFDDAGTELTPSAAGAYNPINVEAVEMQLKVGLARTSDVVDFSERITIRNAEA